MTARKRLAWINAVVAAVLAVLAYVVIGVLSGAGLSSWHRNAGASLSVAPAAAMAAGLASWWVTAWWENVDRDARKWTAFGLALRTVGLSFLLFAPLASAWMALAESVAYLFSGTGGLGEALAWVPAIAVYAVLFGLMLGALPALCIEYFLCRRFLRQARGFGLEGAR
ncbi:hypothetical protein ACFONC_12660 [Luteimonas soli]|uniref:Uncharacterized protein n=1 Tax=Luteimonas soli TaxID=1648966 RepID=A0ABV7XMB8_9GAMM